jgi:chemotaxis family two-component system response regulator Rcp1
MVDDVEIVIAEDNPADVRLIEEALRGLRPPPKIFVASDGEQALSFLLRVETRSPALLFLDLHLPKTDSRDVLKRVKQQKQLEETAVVVLTTSDVEDLIREAYGLGADCYLSKPSDLESFFSTIQRAAEYWLHFPRKDPRRSERSAPSTRTL